MVLCHNRNNEKYEASKEDLEGFPDFIRSIEGVEAALMIFEIEDNLCRMNFRSKGNIIVNKIAKSFNGGGHAFALELFFISR